jgi:hypothetical protein
MARKRTGVSSGLFLRVPEVSIKLDGKIGGNRRSLSKEADHQLGCEVEAPRLFKKYIVRIAGIAQNSTQHVHIVVSQILGGNFGRHHVLLSVERRAKPFAAEPASNAADNTQCAPIGF